MKEAGRQIRGPAIRLEVLSMVRYMGHLLATAGAETGEAGRSELLRASGLF